MCHEIPFYHAGYYLIKIRPVVGGSQISKRLFTCSTCINDGLLDSWSYSWTTKNNDGIDEIKEELQLDDENIQSIRAWVDRAFEERGIGWSNLFYDLETVQQYSRTFFPNVSDKHIFSVYFSEPETADLLSEFAPEKEGLGSIGLYNSLKKKVPEVVLSGETFVGFDIIGIEYGGDFHTFYCHDISKELVERFNLKINAYGLFEDNGDWKSIIDYMNDGRNGFEPVPWFVCKTKLVNDGGLPK
ncbi:MAG TPA: hypothetical protein VHE34_16805 [Puia sp.]|uniref:hypothetical protein n=1 Tax=Puia sp. TaxID=2045100 RepID=UPI002CD35446|nr:hypothetical protein [Puia sp.]HVU96893.1 hypothetical protein [Puia sp.]